METSENKPSKRKKIVAGPIRNSEQTKQKLLNAVGMILQESGYHALTIKNIATTAGLDRKLINHYFGNCKNLIDTYLESTDYWTSKVGPKLINIINNAPTFGKDQINSILQTLFDEANTSADLRSLLSWEISSYNESLRKLADKREELGSALFKLTDEDFNKSDINLRGILAIQIAGIYYLNLHAKINGSKFCEIDVNKKKGQTIIKESLTTIIDLVYKQIQP